MNGVDLRSLKDISLLWKVLIGAGICGGVGGGIIIVFVLASLLLAPFGIKILPSSAYDAPLLFLIGSAAGAVVRNAISGGILSPIYFWLSHFLPGKVGPLQCVAFFIIYALGVYLFDNLTGLRRDVFSILLGLSTTVAYGWLLGFLALKSGIAVSSELARRWVGNFLAVVVGVIGGGLFAGSKWSMGEKYIVVAVSWLAASFVAWRELRGGLFWFGGQTMSWGMIVILMGGAMLLIYF